MKIYCVTVTYIDGKTEDHVHTKYQSATQSLGYWNRPWKGRTATLTAAWVPSDAWKPIEAATEKRLAKVQKLWDELIETDQAGLDALLDSLIKRQAPPRRTLSEQERTEAMLRLDRLVDAS